MTRTLVIIVGLLALLVQLQSLHVLMGPEPGDGMLVMFLLWQAVAALLVTALYVLAWPSFYNMPRRASLVHVFVTCFFLPLAGAAVFMVEMLVRLFMKPPVDNSHLGKIDTPEFNHHLLPRIAHGVGARLLAKLTTADAPLSGRLSAVISLRSMPLRHTSDMLAGLLSDSSDEIRLLAYGTLDEAEKEIMKQVYEIEKRLKNLPESDTRILMLSVRLAELYWELIYQNLVGGEVRNHVLSQVALYAKGALQRDASVAEMYYLLGRCSLIRREILAAEQYFSKAQRCHFPHDRLVPWLAEVAFAKGEFQRIPAILKTLGDSARLPQLRPLLRYWTT